MDTVITKYQSETKQAVRVRETYFEINKCTATQATQTKKKTIIIQGNEQERVC